MRRAEKRASRAELVGLADALGRHRAKDAFGERFMVADALFLGVRFNVGPQPVGVERSGQHEIDGDVRGGDGTRHAGEKRGQSRPCARRQIEPHERHFHGSGCDVDDAAEFLGDHRIDRLLDQLYGHDHVGDDAVDHLLPVELAEIAKRRPGIVVDQNVRLRTGGEQSLLAFGRGNVADDRDDLGAGRLQRGRGRGKVFLVAAVDHDLAAGLGQRLGAGQAKPAARGANDRLAAGDSKVHAKAP